MRGEEERAMCCLRGLRWWRLLLLPLGAVRAMSQWYPGLADCGEAELSTALQHWGGLLEMRVVDTLSNKQQQQVAVVVLLGVGGVCTRMMLLVPPARLPR